MFSTPLTCCSMGAATVSATTWALAPGYVHITCTVGGVIGGYCATGSVSRASPPPRVMTMDRTAAKIGRSMKKREIMGSLLPDRGHLDPLGPHLAARLGLLQPADHHPLARLQSLLDDAQPVVLERPDPHPAALDDVLVVHHQQVLLPLVGAQRPVGDEQRAGRALQGQADADELAGDQGPRADLGL